MSRHVLHPRRVVRRDGVTQRYWVRPDPHYDRAIMSWAQQRFASQSWKQQQNLQQAGITDEQIDRLFQSPTFTSAILRYLERDENPYYSFRFLTSLRSHLERGSPAVEQLFVKLATESSNRTVRRTVMAALRALNLPNTPRLLREIIDKVSDDRSRSDAINYIVEIVTDLGKLKFLSDGQKQAFREALDTLADVMLERWHPNNTVYYGLWWASAIGVLPISEQRIDELTGGPSPDVDALKRKLLDGMAHVMSVPDSDDYIFSRGLAILGSWMPGYALQKLREVEARMQDPHYFASSDADDAEFRLKSVQQTIQEWLKWIKQGDGA
jgi:hypothetical protein